MRRVKNMFNVSPLDCDLAGMDYDLAGMLRLTSCMHAEVMSLSGGACFSRPWKLPTSVGCVVLPLITDSLLALSGHT